MKPIALMLAASLATNVASAQCLFTSVSAQSIGASCNFPSTGFCAIIALPVALTPTLDTSACTLSIQVDAFQGCGAAVPLRVLALGFQTTSLPLPEFGATCMLHVQPDVLVTATTGPFVLPLPMGVASLGFFAQGAVLSVPPFGTGYLAFSDGIAVSLQ